MLKSYLKIALRNLVKNKTSSFINITGLSVGMAVAILIGIWTWSELSFNKTHSNYDRIAQVKQHLSNNGEIQTVSTLPYPLAAELRKNYGSDFKHVVLGTGVGDHLLTFDKKMLTQKGTYFEPEAIEMLSLRMLKGNTNALAEPASILLSQSLAKAYFGDADPLNQLMIIDNEINAKVTGVYEDIPENSNFKDIGFIAPWELYIKNTNWIRTAQDPWRPNAFAIYTQLTDVAAFNTASLKIRDAKLKNVNKDLAKKKPELFLHPMSKWHLYSEFKNGVNTGGGIQYLWMFGTIGIFVLLLACINFMNLSTARSEKRAREVGIRKAIGSQRRQLIHQFLCESLLMTIFAFVIALVLARLMLPIFNQVADKKMNIPWGEPAFWLMGLGFSLLTGLLAGSYPAFYLSSFQPVKVLKGVLNPGRAAATPRKVLVILQFTVSVVLIIGTITVRRQLNFSRERPIGYDRSGLVTIRLITPEIHNHFDAVKTELQGSGTIQAMAETESPTTSIWSTSSGFSWKGKDPNLAVDFPNIYVSYDYGKTIGWQFSDGRDFSRDFATDSAALILNETAVKFMGLKNPIGETVTWFGVPYKVIGVVHDMLMQSPYEQVKPSVFALTTYPASFALAKIHPAANAPEALHKLEDVFTRFNPGQPFDYKFVDKEYARKFGTEERIAKLAGYFTILAVFISCLGLFGMASFIAERRKKEIGIRKVLGASVFQLWNLLSSEFVALVTISFFIAAPIGYYFMHNWLQNYYYRAEISWWIFLVASGSAMIITLITVSFQAIRSAITNPVNSLRSE